MALKDRFESNYGRIEILHEEGNEVSFWKFESNYGRIEIT